MADYLTARAAIAAKIAAVSITVPVAASIQAVHATRPDSMAVGKFPCVIITGYTVRWQRGASGKRERFYNVGLELVVRPIAGATMRDQLDALKDAISTAFDGAVNLNITGGYHVLEGPNWTLQEPEADGGGVWDRGEIVITLKDAVAFAP